MKTSPLSTSFGLEITDIQLNDLVKSSPQELLNLLTEHKLLAFRNQDTNPQNLVDIAQTIGDIQDYPFSNGLENYPEITEIRKDPQVNHVFSGQWHVDSTYLNSPPDFTILAAIQTPKLGGDTVFSDTQKAFSELSEPLQDILLGMKAEYVSNQFQSLQYKSMHLSNLRTEYSSENRLRAIHNAIIRHPITDIPSIYVNQEHTKKFVGLTEDESTPLLQFLYQHITKDEFTTRVKWDKNTIAIWDNRGLQHHAVNDYFGEQRIMHRIIMNSKPELIK